MDEPKLESNCQEKYLQICIWYHPYGRKWSGTKETLDESERREWKTWLKLNIQATKIMASGPNTSSQTDGEKVETMEDLNFFSKITVDGESSHGGVGGGLVIKSCPTLATPWAVATQSSLSLGFSRHEYWIGFPFPSPGYLLDPGIDRGFPALQAEFFTNWATREAPN